LLKSSPIGVDCRVEVPERRQRFEWLFVRVGNVLAHIVSDMLGCGAQGVEVSRHDCRIEVLSNLASEPFVECGPPTLFVERVVVSHEPVLRQPSRVVLNFCEQPCKRDSPRIAVSLPAHGYGLRRCVPVAEVAEEVSFRELAVIGHDLHNRLIHVAVRVHGKDLWLDPLA
jgi:hypothetical protein